MTANVEPGRLGWMGRVVLSVAGLGFFFSLGVFLWTEATGRAVQPLAEGISLIVAFASFLAVGAAVAVRRPTHPIGWLFVGAGVYPMLQEALAQLGMAQLEEGRTALYIIANTAFSWPVFLGVLVVFVPLLFPTGRLPSPRWRWLAWTAGTAMAAMAVGGFIQRDICVDYGAGGNCVEAIPNPIGVPWLVNVEEGLFGSAMLGVLTVCMVGALASVVFRYRAASAGERVQLRWVAYAMGLLLAYMLIVAIVVEEFLGMEAELEAMTALGVDPFGFFLALIPISVGVAILRYRLYDIDRIISRTVAYGLVTAVLVAGYAGAVVVFRAVLPGQTDLAVVASTLGVAALFNPVRGRVQAAVDRRFNRARYDAERIVDAFGQRLRSRAGVEDLGGELLGVAATTMQPVSASLWLRGGTS